ncbi:hypothetical protein GOBAR_DD18255 [Gossypium barbadense]|nr:hypothetical protein GOBAR_DD18255 [Gossypium barbadense]
MATFAWEASCMGTTFNTLQNELKANSHFYQSRTIVHNAKLLAAQKDIKALEELSIVEVEKVMALWNGNKAFRDDYEKKILPSLDSRLLSRDGRIRNLDEKPLVAPEKLVDSETETILRPSEREKRAKKKVAGSTNAVNLEELIEAVAQDSEPEKVDVNTDAPVPATVSMKGKVLKENTSRYRNRTKRTKSMNYWIWAAPAGVVVLVLLALCYYYLA